jgi:hypothetical protein
VFNVFIPQGGLKTALPEAVLSRDGNGAGAPEKEASNAFAARERNARTGVTFQYGSIRG